MGRSTMINVYYKVVYEGDLLPGQERPAVQRRLAQLFGVDVDTAAKLFSGKQHKIKTHLNLEQAKKYTRALAKLGAMGYIEQEIIQHEEIQPKKQLDIPKEKFTETGSFDVRAFRDYFEEQEAKLAEKEKSARHEIFSLDEFDDEVASAKGEYAEFSGVQNVLDAEQIAKMLKNK